MLQLQTSKRFRQDLKKLKGSGKNPEKMFQIIDLLLKKEVLPQNCYPHKLSGNWKGYLECHIEPDWLLIYTYQNNNLSLARTGSHSELFR